MFDDLLAPVTRLFHVCVHSVSYFGFEFIAKRTKKVFFNLHNDEWEGKNPKHDKKVETKKCFFPIGDVRSMCVCDANSPGSDQNSNSIRFNCNQIGVCVKVKWHTNSLWQTPECAKLHLNHQKKKKKQSHQTRYRMSIHRTQTYIFISVSIYQSNNSVAFYLVHLVGIFCGWFCSSSLRFSIAAWWSFKQISG